MRTNLKKYPVLFYYFCEKHSQMKKTFTIQELVSLLSCEGQEEEALFHKAQQVKNENVGNLVYLRGLIEISNICVKDCLYCGIRHSNNATTRYSLSDEEVLEAAHFAHVHHFGSIVLQGGERSDHDFTLRITRLLHQIKEQSNGELGITLSLGEQTLEVYRQWREAGAHRYLLRIESSNPHLYKRIHPQNALHSFNARRHCLNLLRECDYQIDTGVMIGLPFQTLEDLACDLQFLQDIDIDMVGMGPYLEHHNTPLYAVRHLLLSQEERLSLSLRMIALLRLMMPNINIAATTALQAIDPFGREKALQIGANVVMPNITPTSNRSLYALYENKPNTHEGAQETMHALEQSILQSGCHIAYSKWGDSLHFTTRNRNILSPPKD